jgi:hypothetical protein
LNGSGIAGTLEGMKDAINHLNSRGYDLPEATYQAGVALICGFHEQLREFEKQVTEGPYVPFEHKIIPNQPRPDTGKG